MPYYYHRPGEDRRRFSFDSVRAHFRYYEIEYWTTLGTILFVSLSCYLFYHILDNLEAELPQFQLDSIHTTLSSNDGKGTYKSNFTFSIPKLFRTETTQYNFDSVSLFQGNALISNTTMSPVFQDDSTTTRVKVEAQFVLSPNLRQIRDVVEWTVDIKAMLTLGQNTYYTPSFYCIERYPRSYRPADCIYFWGIDTSEYFPERKRLARIRCTHVKVDFSANSTDFVRLLNPPRSCQVYYDNSRIR